MTLEEADVQEHVELDDEKDKVEGGGDTAHAYDHDG
jgi:hypothetical protein